MIIIFIFNDGSPRKYGTKISHFYSAAEDDKVFKVRLNNGNQVCLVKDVTVKAAPNPSIEFLSGYLKDGVLTNCGSTQDNPNFELTISASNASASILSYQVDWGDGSIPYVGTEINNLSHLYTEQGLFNLVIAVEASGYSTCNVVDAQYLVFNGSTPGGSIIQPPNVANLCAPKTIHFPIAGTEYNVPGTTYEFFLGNSKIDEIGHPAPQEFPWTFNTSSCGLLNFGIHDAFVVKMKVSNPCNVAPPTIASVYIGEVPNPEISISENRSCVGNIVNVRNVSMGSGFNLEELRCTPVDEADWEISPETGWKITRGGLTNTDGFDVQFEETGTYDIKMTLKSNCDTSFLHEEIEVILPVTADADARILNPDACVPVEVDLKSKSEGDELSLLWEVKPNNGVIFSEGGSSSENPKITFTQGGEYNVTLKAYNACSTDSWDTAVVIQSNGSLNLDPIADQCGSFIYESDIQFHKDDNVEWDFPGGSPASFSGHHPPPISYDAPGNYSITINTSNACGSGSNELDFRILSGAEIDIQEDIVVCIKEDKFRLDASPSGGKWSGQGIVNPNNGMFNPEKAEIGDNIITYTYEDGTCSSSAQMIVTVNDLPRMNVGADETYCVNEDTVTISGASPEGGWWTGNGFTNSTSGDFLPALAGIGKHIVYYVYDPGGAGCKDSVELNIKVLGGPDLAFPEEEIFCVNSRSVFNHSSNSLESIVWNFGDGETSSDLFPSHVYDSEGIYMLEMTGTSQDNCTSTIEKEITVTSTPTASFTVDNNEGCHQLDANIVNNSQGIIEKYKWDFGDGAETNRAEAGNHLFLSDPNGTVEYEIVLTVNNKCGEDNASSIVKVHTSPVAQFGLESEEGCSPFYAKFLNASYGSPTLYNWDLGDGVFSSEHSPEQLYLAENGDEAIEVKLSASNQCGTDEAGKVILVKDVDIKAFIDADVKSGCQPLMVNFNSLSSPNINLLWDFDDNGFANDKEVAHTFNENGFHNVKLMADNGCAKDTAVVSIDVWEKPVINLSIDKEFCFKDELRLTNNTTNVVSHLWDFGDGNSSDLTTPSHEYANVGSYEVKYLASTALGCTDSIQEIVVVLPKPYASFDTDADEACEKSIISLINKSDGAVAYAWYFGDNTISYESDPQKNYDEDGVFDIKLVARNEQYCKDSMTVYNAVEILPSPKVDFSFIQEEDGYKTGEIQFTNESYLADAYIWNFGDGNHSIEKNPVHSYEFNGKRKVKLIGSNSYGCIDSISKIVTPDFRGGLFLPSAFAPLTNNNESALFMPKGFGLSEYRLEIFSSYGELIWSSELIESGRPVESWDGRLKGKLLPQDVYVWKAHAKFDNGSVWKGMKRDDGTYANMGTITLIR